MMQRMLKKQKGSPGCSVYLNRPSRQESPSAERSTSRGESADTEKTHDEQSRAAPQGNGCLSRGVPADHGARSQVKVNEKERSSFRKKTENRRI